MRCPACGTANSGSQRFCGGCGVALVSSDSETIASPAAAARTPSDYGHYVPGQVLAGRYRMVGLLGRGGMGEVYRADDLKLGQPVALKFLPRAVENEPDKLSRFLDEVRLSLKVTHPNICRVFDIGEVDGPSTPDGRSGQGRHFLSMEYVDGEDLASLLRRIGRLPEDKAIEIARQLCAGLQAAHDEGVLHRDLKPANVMLDGRGRAKITDFGLAGATAGISGREAMAGTPQYMAPEQFDGRELTVKTDLYSLGLVLYELFTGKRAFDSRDLNELQQMRSSTPTNPSSHVSGLSPIVERAILRCLDPDPAKRPESAERLAASLPGGDPLAMALAAGETPSPELVAQSGGGGELKPLIAIACLLVVLAGLGVAWYTEAGRPQAQNRIPLPKPPAELEGVARATLDAAGYTTRGAGRASGFTWDDEYFQRVRDTDKSTTRWNDLATVDPSPLWFWYREAPYPMAPDDLSGSVNMTTPALLNPGMTRVRLDPSGRLQELVAIAANKADTPGPWPEPDWTPLFASAGLVLREWTSVEPEWTPFRGGVDVRRSWTKGTTRIEANSFRGRPTWFRVVPEWRQADVIPDPVSSPPDALFQYITDVVAVLFIAGGGLIARRNMRQERSDHRGAIRLAVAILCLGAAITVTGLNTHPSLWFTVFLNEMGEYALMGLMIWVFYLAVEPYVRRFWPGTLVAWSRVVEGRLRDPMVGRHILLGAMAGLGFTVLGTGDGTTMRTMLDWSSDVMYLKSALIAVRTSLLLPVTCLLGLLVLRVIFRRPWIVYAVIYTVVGIIALVSDTSWISRVQMVLYVTLALVVLTRLGLLAMVVAVVFSSWANLSLATNPQSWFFHQTVIAMATFAAVAIYAFWVSLGKQRVFKESVLN